MTTLLKNTLADSGMDTKAIMKCKNMLALGLVCWLFDRPVDKVLSKLKAKFAKKPAIYEANEKVIRAGWDYGHNTHASMSTYRIETEAAIPGTYTDINGNTATAWGLIMASEKSGRPLFLGSYPITPATDILHELAKRKDLGVKACQMEDEIAGVCSAIGASYGGHLAVTTTSGPGLALKSEGIGLAVMAELPLVVIDVQRGGPSTGLPTKTEQTDLMQALYGRNGESPLCVVAAASPTDCFTMAFEAARIAIEHMTPVILLTDAFIANGSSAWRIPEEKDFPEIKPNFVSQEQLAKGWKPFDRDEETYARYWAVPGTEGGMHRVGGLEKDFNTSVISTDGPNHERMVNVRREKSHASPTTSPSSSSKGMPRPTLCSLDGAELTAMCLPPPTVLTPKALLWLSLISATSTRSQKTLSTSSRNSRESSWQSLTPACLPTICSSTSRAKRFSASTKWKDSPSSCRRL